MLPADRGQLLNYGTKIGELFDMNTKLSSGQLKSLAKGQLLGKYGAAISTELAVGALLFMLSLICSLITDSNSMIGQIFAFLISLVLEIFSGIFMMGLARFYLNLSCNHPYNTSDAFVGFHSHADRIIAVKAFTLILELLCFAPALLCAFLYDCLQSAVCFPIMSIFLVIGGILYAYISLTYSQVYYMMSDFPEYTARKLLSASRRVMKGHKGRLFYIEVSLIPYFLAGICSCGIAFLWILPFKHTLEADFYLDLMHRQD